MSVLEYVDAFCKVAYVDMSVWNMSTYVSLSISLAVICRHMSVRLHPSNVLSTPYSCSPVATSGQSDMQQPRVFVQFSVARSTTVSVLQENHLTSSFRLSFVEAEFVHTAGSGCATVSGLLSLHLGICTNNNNNNNNNNNTFLT
jgi:hypothetical protein